MHFKVIFVFLIVLSVASITTAFVSDIFDSVFGRRREPVVVPEPTYPMDFNSQGVSIGAHVGEYNPVLVSVGF